MVVPFVYTEEEYKKLEEENRKLKSDLAFKNTMLDNVKAEYESSQDVIKKLKERIRFLEQCLDNKEKVNISLREEIKNLKDELDEEDKAKMNALNGMSDLSKFGLEQIKKLEEERDFFKEQAILWRKDWKVAYEGERKLESDLGTVIDERDNAFKKIKQLEERLDNKEKVNKQLREELGKMVMKE